MTEHIEAAQAEAENRQEYLDAGQPGTALATRFTPAEIDRLLAPFTLDPKTWILQLMGMVDVPDTDPDEMALGILAQILLAETSEEALSALQLDRAKELCGGEPGGRSPVYEFRGARSLKSTYDEGAPCYAIVSAFELERGERVRFTTGAKAVQMVIAKHMYEGWMPFRGALEIRRERTQAGFYPLNLVQGI